MTAVEELVLRYFNLASAVTLLSVTSWGLAIRWPKMNPEERLFSMGFTLYGVYGAAVTARAIVVGDAVTWVTPILTIANIWLVVAVARLLKKDRIKDHIL